MVPSILITALHSCNIYRYNLLIFLHMFSNLVFSMYLDYNSLQSKKNLPKSDNEIEIDLGIKEFCITSDGEMIENPKYLRKSEQRLRKLQNQQQIYLGVSLSDSWNIKLIGMVERLSRLILCIHQVKYVLIAVIRTERKHYQ